MFGKKITLALAMAVAGLASAVALPQAVSASDYGYGHGYSQPARKCSYKTVVSYEYQRVPYKVRVLRYNHYGKPFHTWKTKWKVTKVPVYKSIKTCGLGY